MERKIAECGTAICAGPECGRHIRTATEPHIQIGGAVFCSAECATGAIIQLLKGTDCDALTVVVADNKK